MKLKILKLDKSLKEMKCSIYYITSTPIYFFTFPTPCSSSSPFLTKNTTITITKPNHHSSWQPLPPPPSAVRQLPPTAPNTSSGFGGYFFPSSYLILVSYSLLFLCFEYLISCFLSSIWVNYMELWFKNVSI